MYHLRCVRVHLSDWNFCKCIQQISCFILLKYFLLLLSLVMFIRETVYFTNKFCCPTPPLHNWMMCVLMWYSGPYSGRGGADCHDETQRSDGTWWGHAGVSGGHYRLLSPEGAHPDLVPSHRAPEWAERREGDTPSHTSCKKNTRSSVLTLFLHTSFKSRW